jgi:hypothetical protein
MLTEGRENEDAPQQTYIGHVAIVARRESLLIHGTVTPPPDTGTLVDRSCNAEPKGSSGVNGRGVIMVAHAGGAKRDIIGQEGCNFQLKDCLSGDDRMSTVTDDGEGAGNDNDARQ